MPETAEFGPKAAATIYLAENVVERANTLAMMNGGNVRIVEEMRSQPKNGKLECKITATDSVQVDKISKLVSTL